MENGCRFVSYNTIDIHFHSSSLENRVRTKEKNVLRRHLVISIRCARVLIDHSSRPIDVQKNRSVIVKTGFQLHSFVRLKILKC